MINLPEIKEQLEDADIPEDMHAILEKNIDNIADIIESPEGMKNAVDNAKEKTRDLLISESVALVAPEKAYIITEQNQNGFDHAVNKITIKLNGSKNPREILFLEQIQKIQKDLKSGVSVSKVMIQSLISGTHGTCIRIHDKTE